MPLLDFNSLIICNNEYDRDALCDTIKFFRDLGIKNFIVTFSVAPSLNSRSCIINSFNSAKHDLGKIRVRCAKTHIYPVVYIAKNVLKDAFIKRLKVRSQNTVFIKAPSYFSGDWLNTDLNYLLYKQKLFPVFISFDEQLKEYPDGFVKELFKTQNAIFALDIDYITRSEYEFRLYNAITHGTSIVPCVSGVLPEYTDILRRFEYMRKRMGDLAYFKVCKHINTSCKRLWGLI